MSQSVEGLNTEGLDGQGRSIAHVANHALLVLASRVVGVIGVPIALGFFWLTIDTVSKMNDKMNTFNTKMAVVEEALQVVKEDRYRGVDAARDLAVRDQILNQHERRLTNLEDKR